MQSSVLIFFSVNNGDTPNKRKVYHTIYWLMDSQLVPAKGPGLQPPPPMILRFPRWWQVMCQYGICSVACGSGSSVDDTVKTSYYLEELQLTEQSAAWHIQTLKMTRSLTYNHNRTRNPQRRSKIQLGSLKWHIRLPS